MNDERCRKPRSHGRPSVRLASLPFCLCGAAAVQWVAPKRMIVKPRLHGQTLRSEEAPLSLSLTRHWVCVRALGRCRHEAYYCQLPPPLVLVITRFPIYIYCWHLRSSFCYSTSMITCLYPRPLQRRSAVSLVEFRNMISSRVGERGDRRLV